MLGPGGTTCSRAPQVRSRALATRNSLVSIVTSTRPTILTGDGSCRNILAVGARLPTISIQRENVEAGGLMSYGPNFPDLFRRAAEYVDKILRGAKPADIPVE